MSISKAKPIISILGGTQTGARVLSEILRLPNIFDRASIQLFEPHSQTNFPDLYPYMATGHIPQHKCQQTLSEILPKDVNVIKETPSEIDTNNQVIVTNSGERHPYDYLIVALHRQDSYDDVKGLKEALLDETFPVTSTTKYEFAVKHFHHLRQFKGGKVQFYVPNDSTSNIISNLSLINLSLEYLRKKNLNFHLLFQTNVVSQGRKARKTISEYETQGALNTFLKDFKREEHENLTLKEINKDSMTAVYADNTSGQTTSFPFDLLHVNPTKVLPDFLKAFPSVDEGHLSVQQKSLKVGSFNNIWALGYCTEFGASNFENFSKQAEVVAENVLNAAVHKGKLLDKTYEEQAEYPLYLGKQKVVIAGSNPQFTKLNAALNYYSRILVEPFRYKSHL